MRPTFRPVRRVVLAAVSAFAVASACSNDVSIEPDVLAGSYVATSFLVTPSGQPTVDVIAKGGALSITIADGPPDRLLFARGRVAWRQDESASDLPGIGIVFEEMTDANRATLRRMLADAKADTGDE